MKAFLFYLCILCVALSEATYKRWQRNTDFGNDKNWNIGRAPCGNDVVIIGEESPIVYVQSNSTMKELVLPKNGEVIFGKSVTLGFTSTPSDNCPDAAGDVEFIVNTPRPWMSKENWCATPTERGACDTATLLDVDYVPCRSDDVVFPPDHGFFVDLSENQPDMSIKSLKISGSSFTTQSFATFLSETEGQRMFKGGDSGGSLKVTRKGCTDKGGCPCGNDIPEISKKICSRMSSNCPRPRCKKSVQPVGMCCRMCGAYFNITKGYGFDLNDFKGTLNRQFFNDQKDVTNIVAVMTNNWVQLVLTDTDGKNSKKLALNIRDDFNKDLNDGGHRYAIDNFKLLMDTVDHGPTASRNKSPMSGGSIAGIVLSVIILLVIIAVVIVVFSYRRTGRPLPTVTLPRLPSFPGMPSVPGMNRIRSLYVRRMASRNSGGDSPHTKPYVDPGFANPMYDSSPLDDDFVMREMETIGGIKEEQPTFEASKAGFQNPLYGKSEQKSSSKDPRKVDTPGDDATTSGLASTPTSAASPGPTSHTQSKSGKGSGGHDASSKNSSKIDTGASAIAAGVVLDYADTDALHTDSTI